MPTQSDLSDIFPHCPPEPRLEALRCLGASLVRLISMARALAETGRAMDLDGLDRQVGLLCAKTLDLPAEESRGMRPVLVGLLGELDALSAGLAARAGPS